MPDITTKRDGSRFRPTSILARWNWPSKSDMNWLVDIDTFSWESIAFCQKRPGFMCSGHLIWSSRCSSFQLDANKQSKPVVFAHANYVGYMRICVCCPCQVKTYPQELWKDIEDDLYDSEDKGSHNQILTRLLSHLEEWPEMDRIRRHFFPFFYQFFMIFMIFSIGYQVWQVVLQKDLIGQRPWTTVLRPGKIRIDSHRSLMTSTLQLLTWTEYEHL